MFNVDNTSNNDTALIEVAKRLRDHGFPSFDPIATRLRCFGRVLNLVVNLVVMAFLWGTNVEIFEVEAHNLEDELAELLHWRKKGPLGKLHNVLVYMFRLIGELCPFANWPSDMRTVCDNHSRRNPIQCNA